MNTSYLRNKAVEVGVGGPLNIERAPTDIIDGFIVKEHSNISVLKEGMGWEDTVVGLHNRCGDLGRGIDGETKLWFLAIINWEALQKERSKTRPSTPTNGIENKKPLEASAVVSKLTNAVQAEINNLLPDCVMTTGKVVGSIFLATDELFRVEELTVGSSPYFINDSGLQIYKDGTRNMLSRTGFTEKGVEGIITSTNSLVTWHLTIRLDAMFEAVEFPTGIAHLNPRLADVDRYALSHFLRCLDGKKIAILQRKENEKTKEK
jgi:hypothetical protein